MASLSGGVPSAELKASRTWSILNKARLDYQRQD
jgi:hypothetical protein